jgi:hypothetical protein
VGGGGGGNAGKQGGGGVKGRGAREEWWGWMGMDPRKASAPREAQVSKNVGSKGNGYNSSDRGAVGTRIDDFVVSLLSHNVNGWWPGD